jgi:hypothetical protein
MSINRKESSAFLNLFINKIYNYEPGLYDLIKKQVMTKELEYSIKYKDYKLGNWIEKNRATYWNNMSYSDKILFYLNIKVPSKLQYWDNYPLSSIYGYFSSLSYLLSS